MKSSKFFLTLLAFGLLLFVCTNADAQCAMCSATVETNNASGNTATKGLNNGIMYLLAAPYLVVAAAGYIWYKKYRRKNDMPMEMQGEKLHLN